MIAFLIDLIQTEEFIVVLGLSLTFLIVWFTGKTAHFKQLEMKETKPLIVSVERYTNDSVKITIANNKPYGITVKNITAKKCMYSKFFTKKIEYEWKPEKKAVSPGPEDWKSIDQYTIEKQGDFYLTIPNIEKQAIYKIFVETSGGNCQSIYPCQLKHQA